MPVGDLGPDDVVTANRDATLGDVAETLASENVGTVVIAEDEQSVGLVTDRDVALAVGSGGGDVTLQSVEAVMSEDPVTIRADEEAVEISRTIGEHRVRRVPIVDENGDLAGIVSVDDVVATVGEQLEAISEAIEAQSPDYSP
jgi:CBS domain-containing protein